MARITVTMERDSIRGHWIAYWTDRDGYLVRRVFIGFSKREAQREARAEANGL